MTDQKHRKSLTMGHKLFTDMNNLCENIGINSHSYILNLIAREVHRDMVGHGFKLPSVSQVDENKSLHEYKEDDGIE